MAMNLYLHRFEGTGMPIPPVEEHMERFAAGAVTIGVEYRILTDDLVSTLGKQKAEGIGNLNDTGVSLHVFVKAADGDLERLRFDCFGEDPHYHYIYWGEEQNDHVFIDPLVCSDVLDWSLGVIRGRLPQMLERTGLKDTARLVDLRMIEEIMPRVTEAAYRARFQSDKEKITQGAMADRPRLRA